MKLVAMLLLLLQAPSAPVDLRVGLDDPEGGFFEQWAPQAHRAYRLGSWDEVVALTGPSNTHIRYDAELDAARMWTWAGDSGIPLSDELRLPVDLPEPTGTAVWWMVFDVWLDPALDTAYRDLIQTNGGTKFWHIRGADGVESDFRDGLWKMAINVRTGPNCQPPCLVRYSTQMAWEHLGANATNQEPVQPADWGAFDVTPGVWHRIWIRWTEQAPLDEPVSTFSTWIADESRDPVLTHDEIQMRMPWNPDVGRGYTYVQALVSWKETMPIDVSVAVRNVLVLAYDGPAEVLLVKP